MSTLLQFSIELIAYALAVVALTPETCQHTHLIALIYITVLTKNKNSYETHCHQ